MRIGDLSRRTGVPVPTIKYYLRERLLSYGERTAANQVRYGEHHEQRLRLVRALLEIAGLSVASARHVLDAVDEPGRSAFKTLGVVHHAVSGDQDAASGGTEDTREEVHALLRRHGWVVGEGNPGRGRLAGLLAVLDGLDRGELRAKLDDYADLAEQLAALDVETVTGPAAPTGHALLESLVVSTAVGDSLIATLRHLAVTHLARSRFAAEPHSETE